MANGIVVGTTPNIIYTFKSISSSDIVTAILTIKRDDEILLRKELADATVDENSISWKLTQEDTLAVGVGSTTFMCNWVTGDGTRGVSEETSVFFEHNHMEEVI